MGERGRHRLREKGSPERAKYLNRGRSEAEPTETQTQKKYSPERAKYPNRGRSEAEPTDTQALEK